MPLFLLALLVQPSDLDRALERYAEFVKRTPAFSVDYTVSLAGQPDARAKLALERNAAYHFEAKWGEADYVAMFRGGRFLEMEQSREAYDDLEGLPFGAPVSRISGAPNFAWPVLVDIPDFTSSMQGTRRIDRGTDPVDGRPAHTVEFVATGPMGAEMHYVVSLGEDGAPVRHAVFESRGPNSNPPRIFRFGEFKAIPSIPADQLTFFVPNGYVPNGLPSVFGPLELEKPFPTQGWSGPGDFARSVAGKRTLVAVLGAGCEPSRRVVPALAKLKKDGLNVVEISDSPSASAAQGRYFDPTRKVLASLRLTGTPTFFLLDSSGKITHLWMGSDTEGSSVFVSEVRAALKESATR